MERPTRERISVEETLRMTPEQKHRKLLQMYGLALKGDLLRAGPEELQRYRELAKTDLFFLTTMILHWTKPTLTGFHYDLCDFIEQGTEVAVTEGKWHGLNLSPREHLKTTFGMAWIIQAILNDPDSPNLIASAVQHQAVATANAIKRQIEHNRTINKLFPNLRPDPELWKGANFRVMDVFNPDSVTRREPTVMSVSVGGTPEGYHFGRILFDDPVTWGNSRTEGRKKQVIDFHSSCQALLNYGGAELINGTRWAYDELYGYLLGAEREGSIDYFITQVEKDGVFIFPEEFNEQRLDELRATMTTELFYSQYHNDPLPPELQRFKPEFIRYVDKLPEDVCFYVGVDPSTGLALDKCGIVVVALDEEENVYVIEGFTGRLTQEQIIKRVDGFNEQYHPHVIDTRFETYGYQLSILTGVEAYQRDTRHFWNYSPGSGSKQSKTARFANVVCPLYERGKVFHLKRMRGGVLEQQLLRWGASSEDDLLDGLYAAIDTALENGYYGETIVNMPSTPEEKLMAGIKLSPRERIHFAESPETHEAYQRMYGGGGNW